MGENGEDNDAALATSALLISKVALFNWSGGVEVRVHLNQRPFIRALYYTPPFLIDLVSRWQIDTILNKLSVLNMAAEQISCEDSDSDGPIFGHLIVVFRDFQYDGNAQTVFAALFEIQETKGLKKPAEKEKVIKKNVLRAGLLKAFESIQVHLMPSPVSSHEDLKRCKTLEKSQLSPLFVASVRELQNLVGGCLGSPKLFNEASLTSESAMDLVKLAVTEINR